MYTYWWLQKMLMSSLTSAWLHRLQWGWKKKMPGWSWLKPGQIVYCSIWSPSTSCSLHCARLRLYPAPPPPLPRTFKQSSQRKTTHSGGQIMLPDLTSPQHHHRHPSLMKTLCRSSRHQDPWPYEAWRQFRKSQRHQTRPIQASSH